MRLSGYISALWPLKFNAIEGIMKLATILASAAIVGTFCAAIPEGRAQNQMGDTFARDQAPRRGGFTEQGGEALYKNVCQACHMPNAQGAPGAYPALAKDPKLAVAGYPISVVLNGQKAMPSFSRMMSDQQIADVVTYVRTHFGNNYPGNISVSDVKALRP
jgi:mono/diheme cytochrome c family protein